MRSLERIFIAFTTVITNRFSPQRSKNGIVHLDSKNCVKMKTTLQAIATKVAPINPKGYCEF
ncbi:TPA: hypothetical protein L3261_003214 [Elizabethkingia anophelis]|uniref:hypothetical protein n=1 Tax=Elizabethkingia anophelis TaxID=1117645 RepID=UPI00293D0E62|nr:hypothetical protein [Elizabethkingia anophelis]HBN6703401.1 hypothetical protein [Elizabethkingia anophelis]HBN6707719.1 hypothetical protein [Elizabethkingia anophelis]HBN6711753.1 hypothetical protein [Elizabethkingia anophelis]HBN6715359.1 hypothetical protein [Elizabethkingia anophelis]